MARPVTLFTGQWADLPVETMCEKAKAFGYDGLELACWGDHFEVDKADQGYCDAKRELLEKHGLKHYSISTHLVGQAVSDNIDERHKAILPDYVWGDGNPEDVNKRAQEEMIKTGHAAKRFGVDVVNGSPVARFGTSATRSRPSSPTRLRKGFKNLPTHGNPFWMNFKASGSSLGSRFTRPKLLLISPPQRKPSRRSMDTRRSDSTTTRATSVTRVSTTSDLSGNSPTGFSTCT